MTWERSLAAFRNHTSPTCWRGGARFCGLLRKSCQKMLKIDLHKRTWPCLKQDKKIRSNQHIYEWITTHKPPEKIGQFWEAGCHVHNPVVKSLVLVCCYNLTRWVSQKFLLGGVAAMVSAVSCQCKLKGCCQIDCQRRNQTRLKGQAQHGRKFGAEIEAWLSMNTWGGGMLTLIEFAHTGGYSGSDGVTRNIQGCMDHIISHNFGSSMMIWKKRSVYHLLLLLHGVYAGSAFHVLRFAWPGIAGWLNPLNLCTNTG